MTSMDYAGIARRVERKHALGSVALAKESIAIGGGFAAYAGPHAFVNRACGIGLEGPVTDDDVDAVTAFSESRDAEPNIELSPYNDASVIASLGRRGFVVKHFVQVLAMPLSSSRALADDKSLLPEGVVIERLDRTDPRAVSVYAE